MNKAKMNFLVILMLLLTTAVNASIKDTTKNIIEKGQVQLKMQKARHFFVNYSYREALEVYEELYFDDMQNPMLNFRVGECHFKLRNYSAAEKLFEEAKKGTELDPEFYFTYAKTLHRLGKLEEAETELVTYQKIMQPKWEKSEKEVQAANNSGETSVAEGVKKKYQEQQSEVALMKKCLAFAKKAMADPKPAVIKNVGDVINSQFDDYGASISKDGQTMIFTSRRPDTRGGGIDVDGKYFEDIYISTWNTESNTWNKAESIVGRINSEFHDACLSISPDGKYIYVYKNFGENGSGEIYVSKMSSSGKWGAPKPMPEKLINTSYWESSATVTGDGNTMYFLSERKGSLGMSDIWVIEKISRKEWGEPAPLGKVINTKMDEKMVFIHPDGNALFFASDGHVGMGGYDIYVSLKNDDGGWETPINLGYPINSVSDDINFVLSADNTTAYYSGLKTNSIGEKDIYMIDVSKVETIQRIGELSSTIQGTIIDELGKGVMTTVFAIDVASGEKVKEIKTNDLGEYSMSLRTGKVYNFNVKDYAGMKGFAEELDISTSSQRVITKDYTMKK